MPDAKRAQVYAKYDGYCAYCGRKIAFKDMTIDHIKPKGKGGSSELSNLNPSCRLCNKTKATLSIEEFRKEITRQLSCIREHISFVYGLVKTEPDKKIKFLFEKR